VPTKVYRVGVSGLSWQFGSYQDSVGKRDAIRAVPVVAVFRDDPVK
jgi:hypothetical protein